MPASSRETNVAHLRRLTTPTEVTAPETRSSGLTVDPSSFAERWMPFIQTGNVDRSSRQPVLRAIDLFSGVGGLFLGAREAARGLGMELESAVACDQDAGALAVYRRNHKTEIALSRSVDLLVEAAVRGVGKQAHFVGYPAVVNEDLAGMAGELDLLLAGPPCQGHSNLNNKTRGDDPRNRLYLDVPAIAIALDIPVVVIENVRGVERSNGDLVNTAVGLLESSGYVTTRGVVKAHELGWPQTRERFFLVATKGWPPVALAEVLAAEARDAFPLSWLLGDVPPSLDEPFMDEPGRLSPENQRRIDHLFDSGLDDLPLRERPECHQQGTTHMASYGRMSWDRPAPTLTTGFLTPGRGRFVHPRERRTLSLREAARIQGFPDTFRFRAGVRDPGRTSVARWIGNAVPAPMGYAAVLAGLIGSPWARWAAARGAA
jgi:DNA (cytosine-5)-methyltransferase 1